MENFNITQESVISLLILTLLEIILGIDNIIFISITADKLPKEDQAKTRRLGLYIGVIIRIILLCCLGYIIKFDKYPIFQLFGHDITVKKLILIIGGLFLLFQSTKEIHHKVKKKKDHHSNSKTAANNLKNIVVQMAILNFVFSLDSVVTAVGMAKELWVMIAAVLLSMLVMIWASDPIAKFVNENPGIKILALAFLVLIGVSLLGEGFDQHIEKGYIYFAMAFSFVVELINMRLDKQNEK